MGTLRKDRPKYLNLLRIHLPVTGVVSIIHRITGVLLFLSLPFWVYALQQSLTHPVYFQEVVSMLGSVPVRVVVASLLFALGHHVFAGVRFLLFDLGWFKTLASARGIAWIVVAIDVAWAVFVIGWLFI